MRYKISSVIHKTTFIIACAMPVLLAAGRAPADIGMCFLAVSGLAYLMTAPRKNWAAMPDIVLALALAAYVAVFSAVQWNANPTAMHGLAWVRFPLAYVGLRCAILANNAQQKKVMICVMCVLGLLVADTFWQYMTGVSLTRREMEGPRLTGPLVHANIGNLMLKLLFPALGYMIALTWNMPERWRKSAVIGVGVAVCALIPLTGERSTLVLALGGMAAFFAVLFWKKPPWRARVACAALLAALTLAGLYATQKITQERSAQLVEQVGTFSSTVYGQLFKGGWLLFKEHPLTGVGVGRYWDACQPLMEARRLTYCDIHPHNFTLQMFTETGVLGGFLMLALAFACVYRWWQHNGVSMKANIFAFAGAASGIAVLLFPIIVTQGFFSNWPASLFWFSLALTMSVVDMKRSYSYA